MKFSRSYLGVLGASLAGWPTAYALQWTTVEAVLRPLADGAMPVASYSFRNATAAPVTITQARRAEGVWPFFVSAWLR